MTHTRDSLLAFSERVKMAFLAKKIRAPVHLCDPEQAEPLIRIFADIRPQDYVFATWRSMFHALLKGWPADEVFAEIVAGRSMYLMSKPHRFMAGSIVGGMLPIALGVAAGLKRERSAQESLLKRCDAWIDSDSVHFPQVWVFLGDMAAESGIFHEFREYAMGHDLSVRIVIEDNGLSTDTPTAAAWGKSSTLLSEQFYSYRRTVPHVGVGRRVEF